jgi:hypothetical protein
MDSHWSSKINWNFAESLEVLVGEEIRQALVSRAVNNQPVGSFLWVVRRKKQNGFSEIRVAKARMRHQKLASQIRNFTTRWSHIKNLGSDHLLFKGGVSNCPEVYIYE